MNAAADQPLNRCRTGADENQIDVQPMSFERPDFLGHPDAGHAGADGGISKTDFLSNGFSGLNGKRKENDERKDGQQHLDYLRPLRTDTFPLDGGRTG
jgi:hypothetical protein